MNISTPLYSSRLLRSVLLITAGLVGVGLLFVSNPTVLRILGAIAVLLVGVVLKASAELSLQLRSLKESSRAVRDLAASSMRQLAGTSSELAEAQRRLVRVETEMFEERGIVAHERKQRDIRFRELRAEMTKGFEDLLTRVDDLAATRTNTRRHSVNTDESLRELGLRDSLAGLTGEERAEPST